MTRDGSNGESGGTGVTWIIELLPGILMALAGVMLLAGLVFDTAWGGRLAILLFCLGLWRREKQGAWWRR